MSTPDFGKAEWKVERMSGYRISHPFIVLDPGCPPGRHPTRNCGCEVFKKYDQAVAYKNRQEKK